MAVLHGVKRVLKKSDLLVTGFHKADAGFRTLLCALSPEWFARYRYRSQLGRWPDFKNPQTFDEKLLWLMLYWRHPLKTLCGDKFTLRSYVTEHGQGHLLPELLGVYERSADIDLRLLPERFVLKCTHGCGFNIICKDKRSLDWADAKAKLDGWMKVDFSRLYGEIHYAGMQPRIICEPYLDELGAEFPCDYKVYCFGGKAHCTMACTDRILNGKANYDFYDREWKSKLPYDKSGLQANRNIPRPEAYDAIITAAEALSKPFPFVRMDFYSIAGKAVLGEMTFTPHTCIDTEITDLGQQELGRLIHLPAKLAKGI